ncbi:MAG TPA: host-nuclease inhibitor Gam family protein [Acidimicrobiales bacterium]|nr:host-nuclease inhibitor Gam family protein [Acidimicrobiales bacterium]
MIVAPELDPTPFDPCLSCDHDACERVRALDADLGGHLADVTDVAPDAADRVWADRMLAALRRRRRRVAGLEAVAAQRLADARAEIEGWLAGEMSKAANSTDWLESQLAQFHRAQLAADPRGAKTITLPSGVLKARKAPDSWEYRDEEAFVAWALGSAPDLVRTEHSPKRADVKRACQVDPETGEVRYGGEVVPGVAVDGGETTYTAVTE